jgi:diguanylate cyclase (GGDEF)-like protein
METRRPADADLLMRRLNGRDLQLWALVLLVVAVLAAGLIAVISPGLWHQHPVVLDSRYLPQLTGGLIALIVLLNIYLLDRQRSIRGQRLQVLTEISDRSLDKLTDPVSQLFNSGYLHVLIPKMLAHGNRYGRPTSFLHLYFVNLQQLAESFGEMAHDETIGELADVLRGNFRGSDTVLRMRGEHFMVAMSDTDLLEATHALHRLCSKLDDWNIQAPLGREVSFRHGFSLWTPGDDPAMLLKGIEDSMAHLEIPPSVQEPTPAKSGSEKPDPGARVPA